MAFLSEEEYEARQVKSLAKQTPKDGSSEAIKQIANVSKSLAEKTQANEGFISEAIAVIGEASKDGTAQTQLLINALIGAISSKTDRSPTPVRLVINRKDRLISTIDVIPLVKKADK